MASAIDPATATRNAPQNPAQAVKTSRNTPVASPKLRRHWTVLERIVVSIVCAILGVISFAIGDFALNEGPTTHYDVLLLGTQGSLILGFILAKFLLPVLLPIRRRSPAEEGNSRRSRSKCPLCLLNTSFLRLYPDHFVAFGASFFIVVTGAFFFPAAGFLGYFMRQVWYVLFVSIFHGVPTADAVTESWDFFVFSGLVGYMIIIFVLTVTFGTHGCWRLWLHWQDTLVKDIDSA